MIRALLGKAVRESGKPAHLHPHGQILALDIGRGDVVRVRASDDFFALAFNHHWRRIAPASLVQL
jgi:hypothetical protein